MTRRRSSKGRQQKSQPKPLKRSDGKLKRWNTVEDIPIDEEDQFHASRDKILLDAEDHTGYSDEDDEDEVFALKGMDDDSDDDAEDYDEDEDIDDEDVEQAAAAKAKAKTKSKKSAKGKGKAKASSDDEESSDEEEDESWGQGRAAYYSSNADQLDSEDEEANELEEQEAIRLQKKMRSEMVDEDFGLYDELKSAASTDVDHLLDETPKVALPSLPTDKQGLLRYLEKTSPESLALARDWEDTVLNLQNTKARVERLEAEKSDSLSLGMIHLHYQTLLSYSTMLAFYLHLRASPKYSQRPALLQSHPILQRLLTLKQSLQTLEDLDFAASDDEDDSDEYGMDSDEMLADAQNLWRNAKAGGLEPNELDELLEDAEVDVNDLETAFEKPPKKKRKVSIAVDEPQEAAHKTKKAKTKTKTTPAKPIFDLVEPEFVSSSSTTSKKKTSIQDTLDAFGDATSLNSADAADKSARKRSLQFHTSKIESASARRQGARNQASGGDDDIPYRDRKKEKNAKAVQQAAKLAAEYGGADLDDEEPVNANGKRGRDDDEDEQGPDEYYELVKKKSKEEKAKKKAEYEEARSADLFEEEEGSGPRSLTRAILKNKGLTPHRPKDVRNPRVKKRKKFEKAKKKVASQKAVYKGGLSETGGRYGGEKSGITKVVKSVRLG